MSILAFLQCNEYIQPLNLQNKIDAKIEFIKSLIAQRTYESLISDLCIVIHDIDVRNEIGVNFWNLFTIFRWIYEYGRDWYIFPRSNPNYVIDLLNHVNELEDLTSESRLSVGKLDLDHLIQLISNQQGQYQQPTGVITFSRQVVLYSYSARFDEMFNELFDVGIDDWLSQLLRLHIYLNLSFKKRKSNANLLNFDYFRPLSSSEKRVNYIVLNNLSVDIGNYIETKEKLKNVYSTKSPVFSTHDQVKLSRYPFFRFMGHYHLIHRKLFSINLNYGIYDRLKSNYKGEFSNLFGESFENYVKVGLSELDEKFTHDQQRKGESTADFIIDNGIILECKGIENPTMYSVNPTKKNVGKYLKNHILKAFESQILSEAKLLYERSPEKRLFGVVVTYKETNLSFGSKLFSKLWDVDDKRDIEKYINRNDLFSISLDEWDLLVSKCKTEKIRLYEMLSIISENELESRKHYLSMHHNKIFGNKEIDLAYLKLASKKLDINLNKNYD